jgi:membrane protease subunit (stomatin/prohibitin family)
MPLLRQGPGLLRGAARVGVAAGVAGRVQHRQQEKWAAEEQEQQMQQAPQAPAAGAGQGDYTAELEKLAKLRDEGVITPDDFEAKKKQLLGI